MSYNSKSKKAEEFICHEEIEETLRYAEEHKNDVEDMRKILERAKDCKGLSYREAALLLECEDESIHQEIFRLAEEIKEEADAGADPSGSHGFAGYGTQTAGHRGGRRSEKQPDRIHTGMHRYDLQHQA